MPGFTVKVSAWRTIPSPRRGAACRPPLAGSKLSSKAAPVSRRTLKRSERVSRTQLCRGWTVATCSSLLTHARKGGALSHSLVMSHWEGFSMDWHSWSLMWPGMEATWLRMCS